jgi:lipopolysaccharide transport system permease protein
LLVIAALGVGIFFAALNVKYRDVRSGLPFLIQLLFFTTPVIYPITLIPHRFQIFAYFNPACGAISSVKAGLFGQSVNWAGLLISWIAALVALAIGLWYFKRKERGFVDII